MSSTDGKSSVTVDWFSTCGTSRPIKARRPKRDCVHIRGAATFHRSCSSPVPLSEAAPQRLGDHAARELWHFCITTRVLCMALPL